MPTDHHATIRTSIRELRDACTDAVNRQAFAELSELFVPGITLVMELPGRTKEIVGPQAFGEYVAKRIAHLEFFQLVITNAVSNAEGDRATGRMWFHELHQDRESHRLHLYNHHRAHTSLGGQPPITRVNNLAGQHT